MPKKRIVVALGRNAFGKTLPEQKTAVKAAAKAIASIVTDEELSEEYIIPNAFDKRVVKAVSASVSKAADK